MSPSSASTCGTVSSSSRCAPIRPPSRLPEDRPRRLVGGLGRGRVALGAVGGRVRLDLADYYAGRNIIETPDGHAGVIDAQAAEVGSGAWRGGDRLAGNVELG